MADYQGVKSTLSIERIKCFIVILRKYLVIVKNTKRAQISDNEDLRTYR